MKSDSDPALTGTRPAQGKRPYRMSARRRAVEETRERILETTYRLWLEQPFDSLTLESVAEAVGVSRQTLHRQFGSKHELLVAVSHWKGTQFEAAAREVAKGDVPAAMATLAVRYEEMGDANVRALELEGRAEIIDDILERGRKGHHRWVEYVFDPYLPERRDEREEAVMALYAATDVTTWKLLRRDFAHPRAETEAIMRRLVEGVLCTQQGQREVGL